MACPTQPCPEDNNKGRMAHTELPVPGQKGCGCVVVHVCCSRSEDAQQQSWDKALLWASPWEFSTEPVKDLPHRHPGARREDSSSAETQVKQLVNCLDVLWPQRTVMPELY